MSVDLTGSRFDQTDFGNLVNAVLVCGLCDARELNWLGVDSKVQAGLKKDGFSDLDQLEHDLQYLFRPDSVEHFKIWLRNAADRAYPRMEYRIFQRYLSQLS